jgi:ArsR family transcriptional regulator
MPRSQVQELAALFRVLSDPSRLRIFTTLLQEGPCNVSQLCAKVRMRQPTVSHHLSLLRMASLVHNRRQGKEIFYSTASGRLQRSRKLARSIMKALNVG